jgi:HEAT repeat protein
MRAGLAEPRMPSRNVRAIARMPIGTHDRDMNPDERTAHLLATPDEERRFELLAEFVTGDPQGSTTEGCRLLTSEAAEERELGADLLGQVSTVRPAAVGVITDTLLGRLSGEADAHVVASIVIALGHAGDERASGSVIALADHEDAGVRDAVATALPTLGLDEPALEALRRLSRDTDDDVRDWATFGLAESDANDPATIEALTARSDDAHDDTRAEAIFGLARRHDPRARALVDRELARPVYGTLIERARDELDA